MITIEKEKCAGCRVCSWVCPHGVLEMEGKKAAPVSPDRCIECGACALNCEYGAARVDKGTGCLWVIIKEALGYKKGEECCCG